MDAIALQIIPIVFTLLALGHVRTLAGRRSAMREGLATVGAVLIVVGLCSKAVLALLVMRGIMPQHDGIGIGYAIIAAGFVLLMYGFVGWDRMQLTRPGWGKPLLSIVVCELAFFLSKQYVVDAWMYAPISVVVGCVLIMDLMLLGYVIRQRYTIALPFVLLHMASVVVHIMIEVHGQSYTHIMQGIVMTASTSALLFYINMWLIKRHTFRGRMLIV